MDYSLMQHSRTKRTVTRHPFPVDTETPAVILGNGPSLKGFDFMRFAAFDVFGMNAAYRYWDRIGWYPQFYSCLDLVVGLSHAEEISRLVNKAEAYGIRRFLLRDSLIRELKLERNHDRVMNFDLIKTDAYLLSAPTISTGSHTAAWAAWLGYTTICLMGIDANYVEIIDGAKRGEGTELEIVTNVKDNPNYFFGDYQRVGDKYNVPNPNREVHMDSWWEISERILATTSQVVNGNPKSRVDAFPFCDFFTLEYDGRIKIIAPAGSRVSEDKNDLFEPIPYTPGQSLPVSDSPKATTTLSIDENQITDGKAGGGLQSALRAPRAALSSSEHSTAETASVAAQRPFPAMRPTAFPDRPVQSEKNLANQSGTMSLYTKLAFWAQTRNPLAFQLGQFVMWCIRTAPRYPFLSALGAIIITGLFASGFHPAFARYAFWLWSSGALVSLAAGLVLVLGFVGHLFKKLDYEKLRTTRRNQTAALQNLAQRLTVLEAHNSEYRTIGEAQENEDSRVNRELSQLTRRQAQVNKTRRFNRDLTTDQAKLLSEKWSQAVSINCSARMLQYMAHRARFVEDNLRGRLAASIEDILLRTLVAQSVKRSEISVLEIGTLFGVGAGIMYDLLAPHFEMVHISVLDPLDANQTHAQLDVLTGLPVNEWVVRDNLARAGMTDANLTVITRSSTDPEALAAAAKRQYDVLVINQDRSHADPKSDFESYEHLVRPGGYIVLYDHGPEDELDIAGFIKPESAQRHAVHLVGKEWSTSVYRVALPLNDCMVEESNGYPRQSKENQERRPGCLSARD